MILYSLHRLINILLLSSRLYYLQAFLSPPLSSQIIRHQPPVPNLSFRSRVSALLRVWEPVAVPQVFSITSLSCALCHHDSTLLPCVQFHSDHRNCALCSLSPRKGVYVGHSGIPVYVTTPYSSLSRFMRNYLNQTET